PPTTSTCHTLVKRIDPGHGHLGAVRERAVLGPRRRRNATSRRTIQEPIAKIRARALCGETITPMPPAKTRASPRVPARRLVFLFRIATSSRKRRRSAALEGLGSTLPDSRDLI